jgi:hypothetical protein
LIGEAKMLAAAAVEALSRSRRDRFLNFMTAPPARSLSE